MTDTAPQIINIRVRYSEIDGQGVVFNAHYLTYFDTAITEYFRALGYDQYADAKATGIAFHVVIRASLHLPLRAS